MCERRPRSGGLLRLRAAFAAIALCTVCAGDRDAQLAEVHALHQAQRFADALPLIEALLEEQPADRELNHLYGVTLMGMGHAAAAIWPLDRASRAADAGIEDRILLARAHLLGGSPEDAVAAAGRVLDEAPNVLEALQVRIDANRRLGRYEDALSDIEVILSFEPEQRYALISRAELLLLLERENEVESALRDVRAVVARDGEDAQWTARLCAVDATFIFERGEEGHLEQAAEAWEGCLAAHSTDPLVVSQAVGFFERLGRMGRGLEILRSAVQEAPESVDFKLALAPRLAAMGEAEEAERLLLDATRHPGGMKAWPVLVNYYERRGDLARARRAFEQFMELAEPSPLMRLFHADLLVRAGDYEAARIAMAAIEAPELRAIAQGRLLLATGRPAAALESLEEGIRHWPGNSVARQLAAEAAEQVGDYERALSEYKESVRVDPSNFEALSRLATLHEAMGKPDTLVHLIRLYIRMNPRDSRGRRMLIEALDWGGLPHMIHEPLNELAKLPGQQPVATAIRAKLRAKSDPAAAIAFIEALDIDLAQPEHAGTLASLVESLSAVGRHDDARARVDAAIAANPDVAAFHEIRAGALAAAGRPPDQVAAALERALALAPTRASALIALAELSAEAGDPDAALSLYDAAAEANPDDPAAAWAAIALLDGSQGAGAEVDRRLERLLRVHGYHAPAAMLRARRIARAGGPLERARDLAQRALLFQGGPEARALLGWIELERGDAATAIRHLRAALQAEPESPWMRFQLGRALAASGDVEGARRELDAALEGGPFPEETEARAALGGLAR